MLDKNSLERIIPDFLEDNDVTGKLTFQLHIERYHFAKKYAKGNVLDLACGVGYGSSYLMTAGSHLKSITGVDISNDAIEYAKERYELPNITFLVGDGKTFDLGVKYDTIVSLETIEHVPNPTDIIKQFSHLLAPDGVIIASVPITPSVDINPHHVNDFTMKSFVQMFETFGFEVIESFHQEQSFSPFKMLSGKEKRVSQIRKGLLGFYITNPNLLAKRVISTVVDGFVNKYVTVAFKRRKILNR